MVTDNLYYSSNLYETINNIDFYNKFINWIRGEFDLFIIEDFEEFNGIKVYYPSGWFCIKVLSSSNRSINIVISIHCKIYKKGPFLKPTNLVIGIKQRAKLLIFLVLTDKS